MSPSFAMPNRGFSPSEESLCLVELTTCDGVWAAEVLTDGSVVTYRHVGSGEFEELGRGKLVGNEIMGMPGAAQVDPKVYAALEGAIARFMANPLF